MVKDEAGYTFTRQNLGMCRIGVASPELRVADVAFNLAEIIKICELAAEKRCQLILFPELCLTGYSCADLFYQTFLQQEALRALSTLRETSQTLDLALVVGLPLAIEGKLYNCAAFIAEGAIQGIVPKHYLPNTQEYYEERWFTSGFEAQVDALRINEALIPFGGDLLFQASNMPGCSFGVEVCEDLWAVNPLSGDMALAGANILLNPSASDELLGKARYRYELVKQQSARCLAAYAYSAASPGESTTDVVFSGHSLIFENGALLAESERFRFESQLALADIDLQKLNHERSKNSSFSRGLPARTFRKIVFALPGVRQAVGDDIFQPHIPPMPFVPTDPHQRSAHCQEIFRIQSTALAKRLRHTRLKNITLGISGGLDSTLALLVTVRAFDLLGLAREGIHAITMPGFGTSERTRNNAEQLAEKLGVTLMNIPIIDAVRQHFADIGQSESDYDVTYENAQARERTQILMDIANKIGGLNVGTGDLSELALGWATYNGDQLSMYHVNAGVPKTLVRYLVEWCADSEFEGETSRLLLDISDTPITPELLPLKADGSLHQETEKSIGPYTLHDFFLFCTVRYAYPPLKTVFMAQRVFAETYDIAEILRWLRVFYSRFFSQQFKRSAMPDGPKVGTVALSPRGDWRMPSDASSALWLAEMDEIARQLAPDE